MKGSDHYTITKDKEGRRKVGDLLTFNDGRKAYIKAFSQRDFYRDGEKSLSKALRDGKAHLWMDKHKLMSLKFKDVGFIGFEERYTGDIYLTRIGTFFSLDTSKTVRIGTRDVKAVPLQHFRVRKSIGKLNLPSQNK